MRIFSAATHIFVVTLVVLFMASSPATAADVNSSDQWGYNLSLYVWVPSVDGTLGYNNSDGGGQEVDAGSILEAIQGVFMGNFEAHKSRWSLQTDYIYLNMSDSKQNSVHINLGPGVDINTGAEASLTGWYLGLSGAYRVYDSKRGSVYLLAGTRYLELKTALNLKISGPLPPELPSLNLNASTEILDAVVGVKGRLRLGTRWYMPYHLDVGTGTSKLTWEAVAGVGYEFKHWDAVLVYRHLGFDEGTDELLQGLALSGPVLGVTFKF